MNICQYSSNDICAYVGSSVANMCGIIHCGTTRVPCQWVVLIRNSWRRHTFRWWNDTVPDINSTITWRFRSSDHRKSARKVSVNILNLQRLHLMHSGWWKLYALGKSPSRLFSLVYVLKGNLCVDELHTICLGFGTQEETSHQPNSWHRQSQKLWRAGSLIFLQVSKRINFIIMPQEQLWKEG